ncbi:glycoside hydrolase family 17 protein [Calocera cornea HHB12733]|uniref:glucan endo-1,3-beta-D-glucosidase n=1 Tax=Calocera cornea HHB12733 TaxID=1353952 RepID=A0A165DJI3_9BASI|nr:glycoside hydrolase family 17 protein [Calocera cornea HHB12733]
MIVGIVVVVVAAVAGIVAGVVISRSHSSTSNTSGGGSSGSSTGSTGGTTTGALAGSAGVVQLTDPNDPSTYVADPRLHNSFYGFAYTPLNVQLPWCGAVQGNVTEDVILLSQLTTRIRLYGADCNQSALVLEGITASKVDLSVYLAICEYVTDNVTSYTEQKEKVLDALTTYGADKVLGVAVGNEFILNNLTALNLNDPNSTQGIQAADYLISLMADTRQSIASLGLSKTIPVGTADAGSMLTPHLLAGADFGMANVHPWFGNVAIDDAADWTYDFFEEFDVSPSLATSNKPAMSIAETGWPTKSSSAADATDGPSEASVANLQIFMDDFVCPSNTNGTQYFFFEYFDEPWKDAEFGGVEGWWGVFTSDKQLKNLTIPQCTHP